MVTRKAEEWVAYLPSRVHVSAAASIHRNADGLAAGPSYVDDDDDDPYAAGPSSAGAFAFEHGDGDDDVIVMGGKEESQDRNRGTDYAPRDDRWHDGRPILGGFALDPLGVPTDKWYVPSRQKRDPY